MFDAKKSVPASPISRQSILERLDLRQKESFLVLFNCWSALVSILVVPWKRIDIELIVITVVMESLEERYQLCLVPSQD